MSMHLMDTEQLYREAIILNRFRGMTRILFRGFLLENHEGNISLSDIRNPYYRKPTVEDTNILYDMGFYKGATYLLMKSDQRKIERYIELTKQKARLITEGTHPRKKEEYQNSIFRYELEIEYYESQVRRWQQII